MTIIRLEFHPCMCIAVTTLCLCLPVNIKINTYQPRLKTWKEHPNNISHSFQPVLHAAQTIKLTSEKPHNSRDPIRKWNLF